MLWVAIAYTIANFWRVSKPAAWLLVPYIAWVTFAGYLNFAVWRMN
jgi:tryptophan-rich sensory protein